MVKIAPACQSCGAHLEFGLSLSIIAFKLVIDSSHETLSEFLTSGT